MAGTRVIRNDGAGWDARVSHLSPTADYGDTRTFANSPDETMPAPGISGCPGNPPARRRTTSEVPPMTGFSARAMPARPMASDPPDSVRPTEMSGATRLTDVKGTARKATFARRP